MGRPRLGDMLSIAALAIVLDTVIAVFIGLSHPAYLHDDYRLSFNPDATHYVMLGRNFWQHGEYSRMEGPPYTADVLRTPVYPLVAGALDLTTAGIWPLFAFQAACRVALALSVYILGFAIFGRWPSLLAALFVAGDFSLAVLDFEPMSEGLCNVLVTVAVLLWLGEIGRFREVAAKLRRAILIGALLGLAILTRPAMLYLPLVLGCLWLVLAIYGMNIRYFAHGCCLFLTAVLLIAPWVARNYLVFGVAHLTTADAINLVYFAGAGSYAVEHNIKLTKAQEMIQKEHGLVSLVECNNPWTIDRPVDQVDAQMRAATPAVLLKYPSSLVIASLTGIGKALVAHNVGDLAAMAGREWHPPGLNAALSGDWNTFSKALGQNSALLASAFVWEVLFACALAVLGALGSLFGLLSRQWRWPVFCLLLPVLYNLLTIGVVGLDAYGRHRATLTPLIALLAGIALTALFGFLPARSAFRMNAP
jgi:4-amino-4-deoxy-L-arabinose transferase-like glycosyltransferase